MRRLPWAPPVASEAEQLARGTVRSDAEAAGRALALGRGHGEPRTGRRRSERLGRSAREPRILERPERRRRRRRRRGARLARRRCRRDSEALPRARRRPREHRCSDRDDQALARRARGGRPPAVRGRDRGRRSARDGRARALSGARPNADRLSVAADHRGGPARRARLPRGRRSPTRWKLAPRLRPAGSRRPPSERFGPARISCSSRGAAPTSPCTGTSSPLPRAPKRSARACGSRPRACSRSSGVARSRPASRERHRTGDEAYGWYCCSSAQTVSTFTRIQTPLSSGSNSSTGFSPLTSCASSETVIGVEPKFAGSPCRVRR